METITSKRHITNFYFSIIFGFILLNMIGLLQIILCIRDRFFIYLLTGALCIALAFYVVYKYYKNVPSITISQKHIKVGTRNYNINDIANVTFTGKYPFPFIKIFMMEGMLVEFKDMQAEIFFDSMYSNMGMLKAHLHKLLTQDNEPIKQVNAIDSRILAIEHLYNYKGNFFLSGRGIWATIFTGGALLIFFASKNITVEILALIIALFSYMFHRHTVYYFAINEKYFVIKNHLSLWKKKGYNLADIKEIVFETNEQAPNRLNLILNDYSSKLYQAGTFNWSDWNELQEELEKLNIKVRNEIC